MTKINLRWDKFRDVVIRKRIPFYFFEDDQRFQIAASDGGFEYECVIIKDSEKLAAKEFETNYKPQASDYDEVQRRLLQEILASSYQSNAILGKLSSLADINRNILSIYNEITRFRAVYSASVSSFSTASSPTDVFTIQGSDKRITKIKRVEINPTTTVSLTAQTVELSLIKRQSLNSGGTSQSISPVPHDSGYPHAYCQVKYYTANPSSLGTAVGKIRSSRENVLLSLNPPPIIWRFDDSNPVVLRSSLESLCVNLNTVSITNDSFAISIEWEEQ